MGIDYKRIGQHLRAARKSRGLTQAKVSEMLNVAENTYSNIERGSQKPSLSRIIQLCEIYSIKPSSVLDDCSDTLITLRDTQYKEDNPDKKELHLLINKCSEETAKILRVTAQAIYQSFDQKKTNNYCLNHSNDRSE